jgi:hypothetical protein
MNKGVYVSFITASLLATSVYGATQNLNVKSGWNLLGSSLDNVGKITDKKISSVWGWDAQSKKWKAFSTNPSIEDKIKEYEASGVLSKFSSFKKGDGFWVKSSENTTLQLTGDSSTSPSKVLSPGWNLISFSGDSSKDIEDVLKSNGQIKIIWAFKDGVWKAWSSSTFITNLIKKALGDDKILSSIEPNQGYWINSQMATNIGIDLTPPTNIGSRILVHQAGENGKVIPVSDAELIVNGVSIGKTNSSGLFDFSRLGLKDGTTVTVKKEGFTVSRGVIKNGALVVAISPLKVDTTKSVTKETSSRKISGNQATVLIEKSADGNEIALPNIVSISLDGGVTELSGNSSVGSVSVSVTMYNYANEVPMIANNINIPQTMTTSSLKDKRALDNTIILPQELSIIGGANITLLNADGSLVDDLTTYDNTGLSYKVILDRFIGDFGKALQGVTGITNEQATTFNEDVIKALKDAKEKGLIDFVVLLQQKDGSWKYIDQAKIKKVNDKYIIEPANIDKISEFGGGNIVYAMRTKALMGTTKVCLTFDGERMFDGKIVQGDIAGKAVKDAIIVPDEHVISQPAPTDANGCTTVTYKVPFLAPMYSLTAVREGMYNEPITVEIEYGNLNNEVSEKALAKPKSASIKGYVRSKLGSDIKPEDDAIVSLRDPQILVSEKIKIVSSEDNNSIELLAAPNLTYTWKLSKDDSDKSVTIKSGNAEDGNNILKEKDIEDIIYSTDSSKNPWLDKPYGHYYIDVTVKHSYAQGDIADFTEAMTIEFDAQVDEVALINTFNTSINQFDAPVYKIDKDGKRTRVNDIKTKKDNGGHKYRVSEELGKLKVPITSVIGGKDLGWFEPILRPANPDPSNYTSFSFNPPTEDGWISDVLTLYNKDSESCMDLTSSGDKDDQANPN